MENKTYYVIKTGQNRFDLRQARYRKALENGKEHPHDLIATGFTADGMRKILEKWFADTDITALDN